MKKFVSLMLSVMMIVNPLAGVLAEGETSQSPVTETVNVTAPDGQGNTEVTETVDAIEVTGANYIERGAVVSADGASASLTVENEIEVTSTAGGATGAVVSSYGEQGSAGLNAGNIITSEAGGQYSSAIGIQAESTGEQSNTTVVVDNVSVTSTDGVAKAVSAEAYGDENTTEVRTEEISADGKYDVTGIQADSDSCPKNSTEVLGSDNKVIVEAGNITTTSKEGSATAVSASANRDKNTTEVKTGDISADGKRDVTGISANSNPSHFYFGSDNKVIIDSGEVTATSTEESATAVSASANGDRNTTQVITEDISSEGKYSATGISANSNSSNNYSRSDNKVIVNSEEVIATSTEGISTGIESGSKGNQNEITVTAGNVTTEGKAGSSGLQINNHYYYSGDSVENQITITTQNITTTSGEGKAEGVSARADGDKNTVKVTSGDISATGKDTVTGIRADSDPSYINPDENPSSDNKVIVHAGNVTAISTEDSATAVRASAKGDKNTTEVITGDISSEGKKGATGILASLNSGYDSSSDEAVGSENNRVIVSAGNVTTTSAEEYYSATGVAVNTKGNQSEMTLTAGNVTTESKTSSHGVQVNYYYYGGDSIQNKITVTTKDIISTSSEGDAEGVFARANGDKSTTEVTTGNISSEGGKYGATGIQATSSSGYDSSSGKTVGSENKVIVDAEKVTTTTEGFTTGVDARANGEKNTTVVTTGDISADGKNGARGIQATSSSRYDSSSGKTSGSGNKAIVNTGNVTINSAEESATAVSASANGVKNTTKVTTGDISSKGKNGATGIEANTNSSSNYSSDGTSGSDNKAVVNAGSVTINSTEGSATAVSASANGNKNTTKVTIGDISSEGKYRTTGILTNSNSSDNYSSGEVSGSDNKAIVESGEVSVTSTEGSATGIKANTRGNRNETTVTAGNVTIEGKTGSYGVQVNDQYYYSGISTENKTTVTTKKITSTSSEGDAEGISVRAAGDKNTIEVQTEDISADGKNTVTGIHSESYSGYDRSTGEAIGSANKVIINAGNVTTNSAEGYTTAVSANAYGDKNTTEVTTGDISADGKRNATGISASTDSRHNYSGDVSGSDNKVIVNSGNIKVGAAGEGISNYRHASATGITSAASNEGNSADITAKSISVEAAVTGAMSSSAEAVGVSANSSQGGKQTVVTGNIKVKAISKSEFDEQHSYEYSSSTADGVKADATGEGSEVTIKTGSVTSEAVADGGTVIDFNNGDAYANASGSAVDLKATESGNISYTADGDVVLSLTRNIEERDAEKSPVASSTDTYETDTYDSYTYESELGTYTGNENAGLKISVVGSNSEVAAIIKGNVETNSTTNGPDSDGSITDSDVAGVVVGDRYIGRQRRNYYTYDENGNLVDEEREDGSYISYYPNGEKRNEYDAKTGIHTSYHENGTKSSERDDFGNAVMYDENGNEISRTGDLKDKTPEEAGTANVKIEGNITSNGVGLEVVPTLSGGNVNVIVEGTIKGESGAVLVNDNVNAGNFNLTVWKIDPATIYEYDENGEIVGEEESYLEVMTPEDEGYQNDTAAAEELLKQVQYIIKVDPNITNAHVNLDGTTKFTDFTGEEYDIAHEDDKVVVKISADAGYRITGAFNGEGKEETLLRDGDGNYYIIVPRGGGVYLTATVEAIGQEAPEEKKTMTRVKTKGDGWVNLDKEVTQKRIVIPAVNSLLKGNERKLLAALSPMQQLLVVLTKAGFSDAVSASGFALSEEAENILDKLEGDLRTAIQILYRWENGVKVKWYYVEMDLSGNRIARFGFRQLDNGSWIVRML